MGDIAHRIYHLQGSARSVGLALGRMIGPRLDHLIDYYIQNGPGKHGLVDLDRLHYGTLPWLRSLPERFQEELEGLAEGAGLPLQRIAEWSFVEECVSAGCSAFMCTIAGHTWVARNNDMWVPELWGYVTIREVDGRIPTISFGLEGELFTGTGINRERLWLHYNYLPVRDAPAGDKPAMLPFVLLTTALETCRTLDDVEALLDEIDRAGGMMLFAADGKIDACAVFECTCTGHVKREPSGGWIAGTNHYCADDTHNEPDAFTLRSQRRYARMVELLDELLMHEAAVNTPWELVHVLADAGVEQRGEDSGTVYANVVCPASQAIWYTFGGYPAASAGAWQRVEWPWPAETF